MVFYWVFYWVVNGYVLQWWIFQGNDIEAHVLLYYPIPLIVKGPLSELDGTLWKIVCRFNTGFLLGLSLRSCLKAYMVERSNTGFSQKYHLYDQIQLTSKTPLHSVLFQVSAITNFNIFSSTLLLSDACMCQRQWLSNDRSDASII